MVESVEEVVVEEEKGSDEVVLVCERIGVDDLDNAFECEDKADDFENNPCVSKRLRTFHIV